MVLDMVCRPDSGSAAQTLPKAGITVRQDLSCILPRCFFADPQEQIKVVTYHWSCYRWLLLAIETVRSDN